MTARPSLAGLADRLAAAIAEHGPSAGTQLALVVGARKTTVLRELRAAPRFERAGRGPNTVWRLAGTGWEPIHGHGSPDRDQAAVHAIADALAAIQARLAAIEQRLAELEPAPAPATSSAPLNGQLTVDDAIAAATTANGRAVRLSSSRSLHNRRRPA